MEDSKKKGEAAITAKLNPSVMKVTDGNDGALAAGIVPAATMQSFVWTHATTHVGTNMTHRVLNSSTQDNVHPPNKSAPGRGEGLK